MRLTALILIMLSGLSSCGPKASSTQARKEQTLTPQMMESIISTQTISCSDEAFCPEGVARMFSINFADNTKSSMCSAFLVADDLIMTNSHCIWAGTTSLEETCKGLYFAFPTPHGPGGETALCSKILWRDQRTNGRTRYYPGDNDFALIKLNRKVAARPLQISNQLAVGQKVYPLVTDHLNGFSARIIKLSCEVESIDKRGVAILKDCPIISGNSGSAIVNDQMEVVGIVFASTDNQIRKPTDELELRKVSSTKGWAFSMDYVQRILRKTINSELQSL